MRYSNVPAVLVASVFALTACSAVPQTQTVSSAPVTVTGQLGSPSATTTIAGNQLPPPAPKFGGVIKDDALYSKPWWPPRVVPSNGAPNILLIRTDDAGFGVPSTFGGVIPTPAMDRIAASGLRYNRIFSTSLCSPTRAAIITGRNHHSVGFGVIAEQATGFPGYDSVIGVDNATIGRILRDNGYATSWFGKDHNTPTYEASQAGPFTLEWIKWEAPQALAPGRHLLEFDFKYEGVGVGTMAYNNFSGIGKGGTGTLKMDGKLVDTKRMERTIPIILQWDESFDIGSDTITGVNDADYLPPFPLTAKFNKLTIKIDRPHLSPEDIKKLEEGMRKAALGIQWRRADREPQGPALARTPGNDRHGREPRLNRSA